MTGWNYGEAGARLSAIVAAVGTAFCMVVGGWDRLVQALVWFMAADFALGFVAAAKSHKVDSSVMFWGGVNKLLVLALVALAVLLDGILGMTEPYLRTAVIWFYIGREGLSLVENYGKMGLPLPTFVKTILKQIADQTDKGEPIHDTKTPFTH